MLPDILLDDYDPKLLAEAKKKGESFRERDLKGHMLNPDDEAPGKDSSKEFKKEELETLAKEGKKEKPAKDAKDEDELSPLKLNPKEDYQVKEALNQLKAYEIFRHIATTDKSPEDKKVSQK